MEPVKKPEVPPHVQRMFEEGEQLSQRLAALTAFIGSPLHATLDQHEQLDQIEQRDAMAAYLTVLTRRVQRACSNR